MGEFSIVELIIFAMITEIYGVPLSRILYRIGYSNGVVILGLVPVINFLAFFIIVFGKWPIPDASAYRYRR
jgi:hypothetical protein